jgi:hypothetical protein
MLGAILLVGGIILLLAPRNKNDAETLEAIRKELEKAGAEFNDGERQGYKCSEGAPTEADARNAPCIEEPPLDDCVDLTSVGENEWAYAGTGR